MGGWQPGLQVSLSVGTLGNVRSATHLVLALHGFPEGSQYFYPMCEAILRAKGEAGYGSRTLITATAIPASYDTASKG